MLKAADGEIEEVREHLEWQAPDLEMPFMQKVCLEAVLNTRHDVWDIHTNKDRGWVITGPTNPNSQEQFPNMDLVMTSHIGLVLRIPRMAERRENDLPSRPLPRVATRADRCRAGRGDVDRHSAALCEPPRVGGDHLQPSSSGRHQQGALSSSQGCA